MKIMVGSLHSTVQKFVPLGRFAAAVKLDSDLVDRFVVVGELLPE